jgi:membrane fusion protein (multidrug efflux system)
MAAHKNKLPATGAVPTGLKAWLLVIGFAVLLAGCGEKPQQAPAASAPPPPEVGVVTVELGPVPLTTELPGRLEASRVAQVRARVAGIIEKRLFEEGSDVKAGQPLFQIADAPYKARLESARATLARAQANENQAATLVRRYRPLLEANAVSRQDYDNAVAALKLAQADVAVAKAGVETAEIDLGYALVTAPIDGRIGRALVTEGALVGQGEVTALAVVQQIDPIYVNFTQSNAEVLRLRKALASGELKRADSESAEVRILLEDGSVYDKPGRLLFADLTVDPTSGQVTLRAIVPNPDRLLLPGMYVRVRLEQAQAANGVVLPQQAVTRSNQGDTVMVVGPDGKVSPREVQLGPAQGNGWVVLGGLRQGEQVMVDGFQKLRGPGPVKPVPWKAPGAGTANGAPARGEAKPGAPNGGAAGGDAKSGQAGRS